MTIHILLADNHPQYRRNLRASLDAAPGLQVVAEAEDGAAALQQVRNVMPDLVLMDVAMPVVSGIEATRHIIADFPGVKVLALSLHADKQFVTAILEAGASGYVLKDAGVQELIQAIRLVAAGGTYLSPEVSKHVISGYIRRTTGARGTTANLTPRQREILQMIAEGKTTKQIALLLRISAKTVESHRAQLMKRLGVQDIASLVRHALRIGLVES